MTKIAGLVALSVVLALPAQAAPIQYLAQGVVNSGTWTVGGHPWLGVIPVGTLTSLSFTMDSDTAQTPDTAADPERGLYPIGSQSFPPWFLQIGSIGLGMLGAGDYGAQAPTLFIQNSSADVFSVTADVIEPYCEPPLSGCPGAAVVDTMTLAFGQSLGAWLESDALPTSLSLPTPFPRFLPRSWFLSSSTGDVVLSFTPTSLSAVPEPAALSLAALAFAAVAGARVRRR